MTQNWFLISSGAVLHFMVLFLSQAIINERISWWAIHLIRAAFSSCEVILSHLSSIFIFGLEHILTYLLMNYSAFQINPMSVPCLGKYLSTRYLLKNLWEFMVNFLSSASKLFKWAHVRWAIHLVLSSYFGMIEVSQGFLRDWHNRA